MSIVTMNMAKYGSRRLQQPEHANLEPIRGLNSDFLTETKCKIRFIYDGSNYKRNVWKYVPLGGGATPMANAILNFHFDFWNPSLRRHILT